MWAFKSTPQKKIHKKVMKFPEKQELMAVDEDPLPSIASINVNV